MTQPLVGMTHGPGPSPAYDKYQRPSSYQLQVDCAGDGSGTPDSKRSFHPGPRDFAFPIQQSPPQWAAHVQSSMVPAAQSVPNLSVQLPQELPENVEINSQSLRDMALLWEEWNVLKDSHMPRDQVTEEMKRLAHRTGSAVGAASQGAITRQQMQDLLYHAAVIMEGRDECSQAAEFLLRLAEHLQAIPASRSGALVTNIVTGGRQHMVGPTQMQSARPTVRTGVSTQVESQARAASQARSRNMLFQKLASANLMQLVGAALASVMMWEGAKRGALNAFGNHRRSRKHGHLSERRHLQCEASNARAHAYLRELRANRFNPLWHAQPPVDACPYPPLHHAARWFAQEESPYPYG